MTSATSQTAIPVTAPAVGPERPVAWPRRTVRTLANGMQVVLAEQHTFPKIGVELFFRSGNALVSRKSPDLAELTSRVIRTGTHSRTSRQIEEDLRRMGASLGTMAGADTSAIAISGLSEFAGKLLAMVDDLARNAAFPADEFERERRQRLEELRIERTTPGFLASERFRRVLFGEHPYAIVAPTEAQVEAYQRDSLADFYRENYVPSNALLIAVGDFSSDSMMALVEKTFGAWKAGPAPTLGETELPRPRGRAVHLVHLPGTVQTRNSARQFGDHAAKSRLAAQRSRECNLRRRVQFAAGREYSRAEGLHVQPAQCAARAAASRIFQRARRGAQRRGCRHAHGNVLRTRPPALVAGQRRGTRRRDKLFERRFFSRHRDARRLARAAFDCVSELLAGRLSGNVPRESSRAAGQRRSRSGAPLFRFRERANRNRRRPRAGRAASCTFR